MTQTPKSVLLNIPVNSVYTYDKIFQQHTTAFVVNENKTYIKQVETSHRLVTLQEANLCAQTGFSTLKSI